MRGLVTWLIVRARSHTQLKGKERVTREAPSAADIGAGGRCLRRIYGASRRPKNVSNRGGTALVASPKIHARPEIALDDRARSLKLQSPRFHQGCHNRPPIVVEHKTFGLIPS